MDIVEYEAVKFLLNRNNIHMMLMRRKGLLLFVGLWLFKTTIKDALGLQIQKAIIDNIWDYHADRWTFGKIE